MKIYIIPTGWERELVIKTAFKSGADKICLISTKQKKKHCYSHADKITSKINNYLIKELSKFTKVEFLEVNYVDIKDIIIEINRYLKQNLDNHFTINISTGSRLLSSALMFIAFTKNIPIEYSLSDSYNEKFSELIEKGEDLHKGLSEIIKVPLLNSKLKFGTKELKLLKLLKKQKTAEVKDFIEGAMGNDENRLRSEFHFLCKKLKDKGLIKIKNKGKKINTSLTHFGQIIIEDL